MDRQEIIDLLEKAHSEINDTLFVCDRSSPKIEELVISSKIHIFQAIDLLKQPKCKTCGGEYVVDAHPDYLPIPCPDCQQPTAGAFTKKFRELIKLSEKHLSKSKIGRLRTYGKEACDRLDRAEAINKDLLEVCEEILTWWKNDCVSNTWPHGPMNRFEAAITKAKKEG